MSKQFKKMGENSPANKKKVSYFQQSVSFVIALLLVWQCLAIPAAAQKTSPASATAVSTTVVISEFRFRGSGGASDEFIELFNLTGNAIDIGGWKINGSNNAGTASTRATIAAGTMLPAYSHFLATNSTAYSGTVTTNQTFATGFTDDGGVALLNASNAVIDQVGLSTGSAYKEGTPLTSLTTNTNQCYERKPGSASGNSQDTDNNTADFQLIAPCNPQNLASAATPPTTSTNPTGTGTANPSSLAAGAATLLTVAVTPGTNPASTGLTVTGDLTSIGGAGTQTFYNDGTNGDVTAGDNIFSYNATVSAATTSGTKTLPVTITDAQTRTGTANISLTITSASTSPSAVGNAAPNSLAPGAATLLTATVTPGTNPASTGLTVTGNLTSIGGSATQTFYDDGTNGDVTAGDNIFSDSAVVAAGTSAGVKSIPISISDGQARTSSAAITLTVTAAPVQPQPLPFSQNWSNTAMITTDNDWSGVPGIIGYRGDGLTSSTGTDPQTITADGSATPVNVIANQTSPNTVISGGNYEFEIADPVVAFQGSGTASAPHIVINLNTTGQNNITVTYNLRDIDGSTDDAVQPVALQYRVGNSGNYTNVPAAFVADASSGPSLATLVTPVAVGLPSAVDNQPLIQLRIITTNAVGNDELIGIDDILVSSGGTLPLRVTGAASPTSVQSGDSTLLTATVNPATNPTSTGITVTGNLSSIGGSATQIFYDDGSNGDAAAGDNIFSFLADVPSTTASGARTLPVTASDAQARTASTNISLSIVAPANAQEHLVMGNPTNAVTDVNQPLNYLLSKSQYAVGYNRDRAIPNWVSWHLDTTWIGSASRTNDFRPDPSLPDDWYHVQSTDYSGSGFDRGHHTPSGDRTRTVPDNSATFFMTNMMPQAPGNNQGPWEKLESDCRTIAGQGNELYIIAGGTGTGGTGDNGFTSTLQGGKIAVPTYTWKVILILPVGDNDVSRVNNSTRTIAVIMPNDTAIRPDAWQKYLASVRQVEALTGYNFFSNVPADIQNVIESRIDPASNTAPQTVAGGTYVNLDITTPNAALTGNVTVTGTLTIGADIIQTGANKITLGPNATIVNQGGYVVGNLERQFNSPVSNALFPVGSVTNYDGTTNYSPVTLNVTNVGIAGSSLTVKAVAGVQPNVTTPLQALNRYWTLTENGDLTADLIFKYLDGDVPRGVNESDFKINKFENGNGSVIPGTVDPLANTATAPGISQFSDWTLISPLAPTAAGSQVSGRVFASFNKVVSGATVTLTNPQGQTRTIKTNPFGNFVFSDVPTGTVYIVNVSAKKYKFIPQAISLTDNLSGLSFTAQP